ncbi:hypothetical protein Bhyg_08895 [Pseudolycoriella hygida]|uniref:Uncharacterized protein n=1 Tax=Pseudolycoriella hygida TaxID=35572 RepID=A0A9Q0S593_9DIPT|nr:hypothetical protein Bhyg_08895 [Pseudolycoriella hygida]
MEVWLRAISRTDR